MFGMRFVNGGDDVVWSAVVILTSFRPFRPIAATVPMVAIVIIAAVTMVSFVEAIITTASWAISAHILVEANFGLFSIGVLIGSRDHLTNPLGGLRLNLERRSQ